MKALPDSRGFTLIELLVALAIFAILAALSYGGLSNVLETRKSIDSKAQNFAGLQRTLLRMGRDIEQAAPRAIRDAFGDLQPSMYTHTDTEEGVEHILEFTVGGKYLRPGTGSSSLQRVTYLLRKGVLIRASWTVLDRAQDSKPYEAELLEDVSAVRMRYLDSQGEWQTSWPAGVALDQQQTQEVLPRAIELVLEIEGLGEIRRLYRVAG